MQARGIAVRNDTAERGQSAGAMAQRNDAERI
jgi:hypothetical protein